MATDIRVPARAERFLGMCIPDADMRDAVLGDLREEHHRLATDESLAAADHWYRSEVARSVTPFAALPLVAGGARDWIRFVAALSVGYLTMVGSMIISLGAIGWIVAGLTGADYASSLFAFALVPGLIAVWALLLAGVAGIAAGETMARTGGRATMAAVLAVGAFGIPLCAVTVAPDIAAAPIWFQLVLCAVLFPSVVRGAARRLEVAR